MGLWVYGFMGLWVSVKSLRLWLRGIVFVRQKWDPIGRQNALPVYTLGAECRVCRSKDQQSVNKQQLSHPRSLHPHPSLPLLSPFLSPDPRPPMSHRKARRWRLANCVLHRRIGGRRQPYRTVPTISSLLTRRLAAVATIHRRDAPGGRRRLGMRRGLSFDGMAAFSVGAFSRLTACVTIPTFFAAHRSTRRRTAP